MRRSAAFIAFFGVASAISASLVGCGDDDGDDTINFPDIRRGGENESCTRADDCEEGLVCINNICQDSGGGNTGGSDGSGGTSGGTSGRGGSTSSPLGEEGESCTRRADCASPLRCFNQRCTTTDTGDGGEGNVPTPTVGGLGETCQVSSDCGEGLVCLPNTVQLLGVCMPGDSDTEPTGKSCLNAECRTAEDCCELPPDLHATLGATSCAEIEDLIGTNDCETTTNVTIQALCFSLSAYCDCDDDTWECNSGSCAYTADCTASDLVPGGCPTFSRGGTSLISTCDTADSNKCQSPSVDPPCALDTDCEMLPVSDMPLDTCGGGECTCYENRCLRKCDEDLDCPRGYECDSGDDVCVPAAGCSSDTRCQRIFGDVRARCEDSECTRPCESDLECNPTGLINGAFTMVCHDGMCQALGCSEDDECPAAPNGVRLFCTEPMAAPGSTAVSAITD